MNIFFKEHLFSFQQNLLPTTKNILYNYKPVPNSTVFPLFVATGFYYLYKMLKTLERKNQILLLRISELNENIEKKRQDKFKKIELEEVIEF